MWLIRLKEPFIEAYGPASEKERLLDEPLDLLYGIVVASRRETTQIWVAPNLAALESGRLERFILRALEVS